MDTTVNHLLELAKSKKHSEVKAILAKHDRATNKLFRERYRQVLVLLIWHRNPSF